MHAEFSYALNQLGTSTNGTYAISVPSLVLVCHSPGPSLRVSKSHRSINIGLGT